MKPIIFAHHRRVSGFTLIELIVTMAVLAIVVSIAAPSFTNMITNNRSAGLGGELVAAVNFARSEAIKRANHVAICPSTDGESCLTSDDWANGWLIFVDTSASDSLTPVVGTILNHWNKIDAKSIVTLKDGGSAAGYLKFNSRGMLSRSGATDTGQRMFDAYITGCKGKLRQQIKIGLAGTLNTSKIDCP
jgi:type IV fimbrial biogenesis protein FimT